MKVYNILLDCVKFCFFLFIVGIFFVSYLVNPVIAVSDYSIESLTSFNTASYIWLIITIYLVYMLIHAGTEYLKKKISKKKYSLKFVPLQAMFGIGMILISYVILRYAIEVAFTGWFTFSLLFFTYAIGTRLIKEYIQKKKINGMQYIYYIPLLMLCIGAYYFPPLAIVPLIGFVVVQN